MISTLRFHTNARQVFCPECRPGNHAHMDAYGRPEYHCVSSRPHVGWQRVSFNRAGRPVCTCERGQVQAARGKAADCVAHARLTLVKIERGEWEYMQEGDDLRVYPRVSAVSGAELFDDDDEGRGGYALAPATFKVVDCELSRLFDKIAA